ncbi:hypothetical protein B0J15DRAFT_459038 [Fusarium solani]|uniref:Uncharacterized protein n=1 Tax=Fusarium solani TaxID=169388 RepID=A0A9P9RBZ5_FUSSL|nr:uncharacterized protein B0J15DRAFT_459038 [Fusarium solani]KAH7273966.1 hypothetical protein B0J15DRAFT_459038 [Fusarium solani]
MDQSKRRAMQTLVNGNQCRPWAEKQSAAAGRPSMMVERRNMRGGRPTNTGKVSNMEGIQKWHPSNRSLAAPLSSFQNAASCASSREQAQATGSGKDLAWAILEDGAALQEQQAYLYVLPTCRCPLLRCITWHVQHDRGLGRRGVSKPHRRTAELSTAPPDAALSVDDASFARDHGGSDEMAKVHNVNGKHRHDRIASAEVEQQR